MAITLITNVAAGSSDNNNVTTAGVDTSGASLLVAVVAQYTSATGTISDSKGNTWTPLTRYGNPADGNERMYYAVNPTVGAGHTFTFSSTTTYPSIAVMAFGSVATSTPLDQQNGVAVTSSTSFQPGSVTPSENNEVVVSAIAGYQYGGGVSIDSSFTITDQVSYSANHMFAAIAYKIQTTAGAENPTWSWAAASVGGVNIATFKMAAAGGTVFNSYYYRHLLGGAI